MLVKSQGQYFILAQIWCPHFETVLVIFSYSTINMPLYQSIYGITLNIIKELTYAQRRSCILYKKFDK